MIFLFSFYVCCMEMRTIAPHAKLPTSFEWFGEKFVHWPDQLGLGFRRCLKVGEINLFGKKR